MGEERKSLDIIWKAGGKSLIKFVVNKIDKNKMQTQIGLIFRDIGALACLILIFTPSGAGWYFWAIMSGILLTRQYKAHKEYYKLNKRIY